MALNLPQLEEKILKFWKKNSIFEKSLKKKAKDFVFYEGPPTANAPPGLHHVLARVFKDIICRYKTMVGFRVQRKAGWDTHGLPVEIQIEKKLNLKHKKEIEKLGIEKFNLACKKSVWEFKKHWEKLTERIGFWLDLKSPYITYEANYIESLWYILKKIWEKKLLVEDFKVVPWCPRCQTPLSSHEVALGYKKIKELAIYVKFEIQNTKEYLLVWTTTPWTLLGNLAVAVNENFDYVKVKTKEGILILAKERIKNLGLQGQILEEFKGKKIVGKKYSPPFSLYQKFSFHRVLGADFVSLKEGTGLVHIAPAFGEEDFLLCREKIPNFQYQIPNPVDEEGRFKKEAGKLAGIFVKEADNLILEDLKERQLLFKQEMYEHDYPFCWRCQTPLLYYAKKSWFLKMTKVKEKLLKNNDQINWIPNFLKWGRFGEWLKEVKDWALSRERYWGTPLPIWECPKCNFRDLIGSKKDLSEKTFTQNTYFILRHGEAKSNLKNIVSCWPEKFKNPLTKKGRQEIENLAKKLKNKKIDLIISSDLLRAKQSAEILAEKLNVKLKFDKRIREFNVGKLNGLPIEKVGRFWDPERKLSKTEYYLKRFKVKAPGGESFGDLKMRMYKFLLAIDKKYKGKRILIVGHEAPLSLLEGAMKGLTDLQIIEFRQKHKLKTGQFRKLDFQIWPYDKKGNLDFHRPFVDEIKFYCPRCSGLMERVKDVIDCWFDSGAMPFSQVHWPFEQKQKSKPPQLFPANFICEGIDQTRGWFYTLLAISTLLDFGPAYKNVISVGLVLDEKGEKMSKSKGNVVDPWLMIKKYGADTLRWYFFTINQPYLPKRFSEKDLESVFRRFILLFWNCFNFYQMYSQKTKIKIPFSQNILDKWILSRLMGLIQQVSKALENYDVTGASRSIEKFLIDDLSLWYIRRSRKRLQKKNKEGQNACQVLGFVLLNLSKLTAPFLPFFSEFIYQNFNLKKSVHWESWPKVYKKFIDKQLEKEMEKVREIVSLALGERKKAQIKIRQPLAKLVIEKGTIKEDNEFLNLIKDEVNVKEVVFGSKFFLDTKIDVHLKKEGILREFLRQIQQARKEAGLLPKDLVGIKFSASDNLEKILFEQKNFILKEGRLKFLEKLKEGEKFQKEFFVDQEKVAVSLEKIK